MVGRPFEPGWRGGPGRPPGPRILNVESAQALLRSAKKIGDLIARERGDGATGLEGRDAGRLNDHLT